jgi:PadR family transcriptional regulator PadR
VSQPVEVLQGTLDLLILKALLFGPLHGWGISKRVRQLSNDAFQVYQGSLYPALYRLEDKGWVESDSGASAEGRKVRVYRLTPKGRRAFAAERESWRVFSTTLDQVLAAE